MAEVISPGRADQDRSFKRARYAALGVPAYWIGDPAVPSLTELRLAGDGRYAERMTVTGGDAFTTDYPFAVELSPAELAWAG